MKPSLGPQCRLSCLRVKMSGASSWYDALVTYPEVLSDTGFTFVILFSGI